MCERGACVDSHFCDSCVWMSRGRSDRTGLLTLMGEAHELEELEPFTPAVLERVADSLGSTFASYFELEITTGVVLVSVQDAYQAAVQPLSYPLPIPRVHSERHLKLWKLT